jgi:hypothetical protein
MILAAVSVLPIRPIRPVLHGSHSIMILAAANTVTILIALTLSISDITPVAVSALKIWL